jgi:CheY-like chemotaxis protein
MRILIVEDDDRIAKPLAEDLRHQHHVVEIATDGIEGWEYTQAIAYDLILLDLMLPKLDGISLCQQLCQVRYNALILMLTAKDTTSDKIIGLDAGADDYLVKPFALEELAARIRTLCRRSGKPKPPINELHNTLRRLDYGLGIGIAIALLASGIGSIWLTRRAMQPIEASFELLKQFTGDASHELRSPLMAIKTNADVALTAVFDWVDHILVLGRRQKRCDPASAHLRKGMRTEEVRSQKSPRLKPQVVRRKMFVSCVLFN